MTQNIKPEIWEEFTREINRSNIRLKDESGKDIEINEYQFDGVRNDKNILESNGNIELIEKYIADVQHNVLCYTLILNNVHIERIKPMIIFN